MVLGVCAGAAHGWLDLVGVGTAVVFVVVVLGLALALADWFRHESLAIGGLAVSLMVPGFIGAWQTTSATWAPAPGCCFSWL